MSSKTHSVPLDTIKYPCWQDDVFSLETRQMMEIDRKVMILYVQRDYMPSVDVTQTYNSTQISQELLSKLALGSHHFDRGFLTKVSTARPQDKHCARLTLKSKQVEARLHTGKFLSIVL